MNIKAGFFRRFLISIACSACLIPLTSQGMTHSNGSEEPYRIIVKPKSMMKASTSANSMSFKIANLAGVNVVNSKPMAGGSYVLTLDKDRVNALSMMKMMNPKEQLRSILATLNSDPSIEYAVENKKLHALAFSHDNQWDEFGPPGGVDVAGAWSITKGDPNVVVAVLDTGIVSHSDLDKNILNGFSFVTHSMDATDLGLGTGYHGTHVTGTIAANGTLFGMAPNVKILPIQVLGDDGIGDLSDIIDGMYWAAGQSIPNTEDNLQPAKVINLSLGGDDTCNAAWADAMQHLYDLNVSVVVAAGNEDNDAAFADPGNCDHTITVAATNRYGIRAPYSNYGNDVDIAAPGGETKFLDRSGGILSTVKDGYAYYQGTSMAAPHVAGIAALLYSVDPELTPDDILQILQDTSTPFARSTNIYRACTGKYSCGVGIVNAANAVHRALDLKNSKQSFAVN